MSNKNINKTKTKHFILGSMMSGKSEYILRKVNLLIKSGASLDKDILPITGSQTKGKIESRISKYSIPAYNFNSFVDACTTTKFEPSIVFIDEYHLLSNSNLAMLLDILENIDTITDIYVVGLKYDWLGERLDTYLIDNIKDGDGLMYLWGICDLCGADAMHHYKISGDLSKIIEEKSDEVKYGVLCQECFEKRKKE